MKKIISQISLILFMIIIGMTSVLITEVNASLASLSVSSATEGGTFTVTLNLPAEAVAASANITVTYSDGSTQTKELTYMNQNVNGMQISSPNSVQFTAKVAGQANISATTIRISDADRNRLEDGGSVEQSITIASNPSTQPQNPTPTTPSEKPNTTTPSTDKPTTNAPTEEPKKENDKDKEVEKEPEIVNPTFKDVKETVYAVNGCNVRSSCSTEISSNKIGGLVKGQAVTRTGVEGTWSRIEYNGKTAYVATRLLTTEKPVEEPENKVENTITNNTISNNTIANNTVKNEIETSNTVDENIISDEEILNQIEQEIGVLPEVGHNIATILFTVISALTLIIVMRLQYNSKE